MSRILFFISTIGITSWLGLIIIQGQDSLSGNGNLLIKSLRIADGRTDEISEVNLDSQNNKESLIKTISGVGGPSPEAEQEIQEAWRLFSQAKIEDGTSQEIENDLNQFKNNFLLVADNENEILMNVITEDTNNDQKNEYLVVTKKINNKNNKAETIFYILDSHGQIIFEYSYVAFSPDEIELKNFGSDAYPSYFLVFDNQISENRVLRWNGNEYILQEI